MRPATSSRRSPGCSPPPADPSGWHPIGLADPLEPVTRRCGGPRLSERRCASTWGDTVSTPIGIAVIGAGYWGPNLVRNAQATPGLRLEYLCDLNEARAREVLGQYTTVRVSTSLDEVLADPQVQAVAIATPAGTHVDIALAAIAAGKHVLVEKPLAATWADGAKVVQAAEDAGVVLMLDHTYCYTPAVSHLRELLR